MAVCSSKGNTGTSTALGTAVLFFNCLTATAFVVSGGFFTRRETWLIEWLDADDEFPPTHLRHVIDAYPRVRAALRAHNHRCLAASRITAGAVLLNFLLSACYLLRNVTHAEKQCCPGVLPGGACSARCECDCNATASHARLRLLRTVDPTATKTVSALLTNTLLVALKLLHHMSTTGRSLRETSGVSSVHQLPLVYNVIDADHVADKEEAEDAGGDSDEGEEMQARRGAAAALGGIACCACVGARTGDSA